MQAFQDTVATIHPGHKSHVFLHHVENIYNFRTCQKSQTQKNSGNCLRDVSYSA
jgi:hypothetical protein